jgi:hypothetical protein
MDEAIEIIQDGIEQAKIGEKEKLQALRRLKDFLPGHSSQIYLYGVTVLLLESPL